MKKFQNKIHVAGDALTKIISSENKEIEAKTVLNEAEKKSLNEKAVLIYLNIQKNKEEFEDTVEEEYIEKVIMFGFLVVRIAK